MRSEEFFFLLFLFLFFVFPIKQVFPAENSKRRVFGKKKIIALKIILPYLQICKSRKFQRLEGRKIISN